MQLILTYLGFITFTLFVTLRGELPNIDDDLNGLNYTTLWELLKRNSNPFLQDLQGHWSFNDTSDISKYEEFDHTRFQGSREPSLDELLEKVKELRRAARRKQEPVKPTSSIEDLPVFDTTLVTNVTAHLAATAFLSCRIKNLNKRTVSWIRKRDWHILTVDHLTYTNDNRFQVLHKQDSEDWILQIKYVQMKDDGEYECQVATGSGTISHHFNLHVTVPTAYILEPREYHIGRGSTLSLVCIIENSQSPPQYVMWQHNDKIINLEDDSDSSLQVQVATDPGGAKTHSRLIISDATTKHSGNYSCRAGNSEPDSVYVFVSTEEDNIAAIQRQNAFQSKRPSMSLLFIILSRIIIN